MKPHTYTFNYRDDFGALHRGATIEATSKEGAYRGAVADTRFKGCEIKKASFRRIDARTAYEKAEETEEATLKDVQGSYETIAYKAFLKHLNLAIESLYVCHMENNAAVLSMPIKQLYEEMRNFAP